MAMFKCKMCGGSLEVTAGAGIVECEYCGTQQTLPKTTDDGLQSLFNRAHLLRQKCEFDKAEALYEKILEANGNEAEAYWGVILCKFGIEYVEDPKTYKRIPTCHRTSYDSIIADEYYKKALECADSTQKAIYEAEARVIDDIQKNILAISSREEPYDVFICYKESDESGARTQDSVIANDIYYQLTAEGYKVFYAAITLEDKLGSAYEPIIFAALNSAKVMLAIGTKPEYFNAVWVKNEWSRFLKMIKNDRSKLLIPCYRDMDAYELPEEFAHLQAQNMGKIGFINDVVRGIKKVIVKDEPRAAAAIKEAPIGAEPGAGNVSALLRRAYMFLEDKNWDSAEEYCEKVLDIDPENAEAYLGKLLGEYKLESKAALRESGIRFDESANYRKILKFGDEALTTELRGYIEETIKKNEELRLTTTYAAAANQMNFNSSATLYNAAKLFGELGDYKDSLALRERCLKLAEECKKNETYDGAVTLMRSDCVQDINEAIKSFESLADFKDSQEKIGECKERLLALEKEKELEQKKKLDAEKLEKQKQLDAIAKAKKDKIKKIIIGIVAVIALVGMIFAIRAININKKKRENPGDYVKENELTHFDIPNGVTEIRAEEFRRCTTLRTITIPDSVTTINSSAFIGCEGLESIKIPYGVKSIKDTAFYGCERLTSVIISNSVTSIGRAVFDDCKALTSIYYTGTADEWNAIVKDNDNATLNRLTIYYYSETEPAAEGSFWHYDNNGKPIVW
ncbi:MAG: leucine-rich repeat protein [Clostridia bacterium]|nr:leucine-rich repeat protein [Clostridia bacterium]